MAISCPNKSSKEWLDLVASVGEVKAMLAFVKNNEVIPSIDDANLLFNREQIFAQDRTEGYTRLYRVEPETDVDVKMPDWVKTQPEIQLSREAEGRWFYLTLEEAKEHIKKFGGSTITYVDILSKDLESYNAKDNKFAGGYGREGNEYFLPKDIANNKIALRKLTLQEAIDTKKEVSQYHPQNVQDLIDLVHSGKISKETYVNAMQMSFGEPEESSIRMYEKLEAIRKFIPFDVNVILDDTAPDAGLWERDKKLITINPITLKEDVIGHEVGHILLELLGGMSNPLVRRARQQLINSDVESEVLDKYSEDKFYKDNPSMFDLEIICTALGYDSVKLFKDPSKIEKWDNWLVRFFHYIKQLLGIEKDAVRSLASMLFTDRVLEDKWAQHKQYVGAKGYKYDIKSARKIKVEKESITSKIENFKESDIDRLESFRGRAVELLERRQRIYKKKSRAVPTKENAEFLENMRKATDKEEALYNFVQTAKAAIDHVYLDYMITQRPDQVRKGKGITPGKLMYWKDYINGFGLIREMAINLKPEFEKLKNKSDNPDFYKKERRSIFTDPVFAQMQEIVDKKDEMTQVFLNEGLNQLVEFLKPHYKTLEIEYKDEIERRYNKLSTEQKQKQSLDEYINKELELNADTIKKLTEQSIRTELLKAQGDVGQITRWLDTIVDSTDPVISAMIDAFTDADFKTNRETNKLRDSLVDRVRELEDFYNTTGLGLTDVRKMYDFILEKDDDGNYTGYLIDRIKSSFYREYNQISKDLSTKGASFNEIKEAKRKFMRENTRTDWDRKNADEDVFLESLRKEGSYDLTRYEIEEYQNYRSNLGTPAADPNIGISDIFKSSDVLDAFKIWNDENYKNYIEYKPKWINPQYNKLSKILENKDDPRSKFYNFITKELKELESEIPFSQRLYFRLPRMLKDSTERFEDTGLAGVGKTIKDKASRLIKTKQPEEVTNEQQFKDKIANVNEEGDPVLFMPTLYNGPVSNEDGTIKEDQSLDLGMLYYNYLRMAIDYKNKKEILPSMELAKYFVTNRKYLKLDENGNVTKDALDPNRIREIKTKGQTSNLAAQLNDWFEAVFYGMRYKEEGLIPGTNWKLSKTLDNINRFTAVNMLGVNFVQGTANLLLGQASQWIESVGANVYNPKDYAYAEWYYTTHLPKLLGDIGSRKPKSIINLLNEEFDTINEYEDGKMKNNTRIKKLFNSDTLFFTSHAGEHMIQSQFMLAMLHNRKAIDSQGKIIGNILDLYSTKNGKLIFDDNKNRVVNWTDKDQKDFQFKMKRFMADIHGDYYKNSIPAFQRLAVGRMAGLFRKFVVPGFKRRWGNKHADNLRQQMVEGYYMTFGRFVGKFMKDLATLKMQLVSEDWSTLTKWEKANIRKVLAEISFLAASLVLGYALTNLEGDDDEPDNWWIAFGAYQSYRFMNEISFFISPTSFMNIMRSPAASMSIIENLMQFFGQIFDFVDGPFERYDRGPWKGHLKLEKLGTNFVPLYKQYYRLRDVDQSVSWWKN
jgi:hypothetical protein